MREFIYLANTYKNYFINKKINLYSTKKVELPASKLYVIYTGDKKISKKEISLNEEYFDGNSPIDIKVYVLTLKEKSNDILMQYIKYSKIIDKNKTNNKKALLKLLNKCIEKDILKEYLQEHKKEVLDMLSILYDQDYVTECYEKEIYDEGMQQGGMNMLKALVRDGLISKEEANRRIAQMK